MNLLWKEAALGILKIKPNGTDWPDSLDTQQLTQLQFQKMGESWVWNKQAHKEFNALLRVAISEPFELAHESKYSEPVFGMLKDATGSTLVNDVRFVTTFIKAQDFAVWLEDKHITPSKYIQAWFDAVGVAGAATPDVSETIAQRNARWLAQLDAAQKGLNPPSGAEIYRQIEAAEGVKAATVKKAVDKAKKDRADDRAKALTRGKNAKKTLDNVWGHRIGK